ncbi:MAG: sigma-70 family RNA polymerase sigma factor [Lentisphaeria bacterium]|nr:sigma-70 family RNA polymerase sigma factor [Lentisphaeria bacterium]
MKQLGDKQLIVLCRKGDERAFGELYGRYRLQLYSYLNRLLPRQEHLVDDMFQQTWIKVFDGLDKYVDDRKFISWLYRIAHNLVVDHIRREVRRPTVELDERLPAETEPVWKNMDKAAVSGALERAIETLSLEQREVVMLRRRGVAFKDIAGIQNSTLNTVLGRMHYAVKHLRRWFESWEDEVKLPAGAE